MSDVASVASSVLGVNAYGHPIIQAYPTGKASCFFLCPYCGGTHYHGYGDGWRVSHCKHPPAPAMYDLKCSQDTPPEVLAEKQWRESKKGRARLASTLRSFGL